MKKNLLAVVILALLIVNLVLTGIIMFSTVSANKKTVALVNDIATVLNLELTNPIGDLPAPSSVPIADSEPFSLSDSLTIALRPSADGSEHYCMCEVGFSINKNSDDYQKLQPMLDSQQNKIKSIISNIIGEYTKEDVIPSKNKIQDEILTQVQALFGSNFIYEAYFYDIKVQ